MELLSQIRVRILTDEVMLPAGGGGGKLSLLEHSITRPALTSLGLDNGAACHALVDRLAADSHVYDRSVGCIVGLTLGDGVGAPLEFLDVDTSLPPLRHHGRKRERSVPVRNLTRRGVAIFWGAE